MADDNPMWTMYDGPPRGGGFGWDVPGTLPGHVAQLRRMEALERAAEAREADERAARIEARREAWMWARAQQMAFRGQPFDLTRPETLAQPLDEFCAQVFDEQDRESRRAEFAAAKEAGLLHLLNISPADMAAGELVLQPREQVEERAVRTELLGARRATYLAGVRAKASRALATIRRATEYHEAVREISDPPAATITRGTHDPGRIIR